jgi:hypothetical protein
VDPCALKTFTLCPPCEKPHCFHHARDSNDDEGWRRCVSRQGQLCPHAPPFRTCYGRLAFHKNHFVYDNIVYKFLDATDNGYTVRLEADGQHILCTEVKRLSDFAATRMSGVLANFFGSVPLADAEIGPHIARKGEWYESPIMNDRYVVRKKHHVRDFAVYDRSADTEYEFKTGFRGYPSFVLDGDLLYCIWRKGHKEADAVHGLKLPGGMRVFDLKTRTMGPPLRSNLPFAGTNLMQQVDVSPFVKTDNGTSFVFNVRSRKAWTYKELADSMDMSIGDGETMHALVDEQDYRQRRWQSTYAVKCPVARKATRRRLDAERDERDVSPKRTYDERRQHLKDGGDPDPTLYSLRVFH